MTLHKLSAGNGYTYLTRQVAANDATATGYANLGEYYSERGEAPGRWLGSGLATLDQGPAVGDPVSEAQMVALFGKGRHPNANALEARALAAGHSTAVAAESSELGKPFGARSAGNEFRRELARRIVEHNQLGGLPAGSAVPDEVRAALRSELGRDWFVRDTGRQPRDERELTDYVTAASRSGSTPVAGYDLTFSPVKSVSTLWALASTDIAAEVEAAHDAAVRDVIGWLEQQAVFTRLGRDGIRQVDVRGLLAVAFTHRDSRAGDPDLHTHVAISNKVQTLDGRWRALDGRVLHRAAVAASERYNTRLEAHLMDWLGVRFAERPGAGDKRPVREIEGIDPALNAFWSKRRTAITARHEQLAAEFTKTHGRAPDPAESVRLFGRANTDTRQGKHVPRSQAEQRAAWRDEAAAVLGTDIEITAMLNRAIPEWAEWIDTSPASPRALEEWIYTTAFRAVGTVAASRSCWRLDHVRAEVERAARTSSVPLTELDGAIEAAVSFALSADVSVPLGQPDLIEEPLPLRRRDGTSVFTVAGSQLYTSPAVLDAESRLLAAAKLTGGRTVDAGTLEIALLEAQAAGRPLNDSQTELVRALATSGARLQLALAPAGSGKTTALGVLARAWTEDGGDVVGLAPSAAAAAQLRDALGSRTDTIAKLLHSINADSRPEWVDRIGARTLVIVDEAGMAGTADLDRVTSFVLTRGGSVRLVGDVRQLAARQSGGVLRDIAETVGAAGLDTLVRFDDPAEAHASLAVRTGDPIGLGYYLGHGRVHAADHTSVIEQAYAAWHADREAGCDSIILAATNRVVQELNARARANRLARSTEPGRDVPLHNGTAASTGDPIVTRRNNRQLPISSTDWVKNGDRWHVDSVAADGSLNVTHTDTRRRVVLPADYVSRHVELGYAMTVHLAQGRTADTCHTVLTGREAREVLYVAVSRGRTANHLYLDATSVTDDHAATTPDAVRPPTTTEVLERILANESAPRSATSQHRLDNDPIVRLQAAASRYVAAVTVAPGTPGHGDGPLPWLPPLPDTDPAWSDYLDRRFELVGNLAETIDATNALPAAQWAQHLREHAPAVARGVALWRITNNVTPDDLRPCGPPVEHGTEHHKRLTAQVENLVGETTTPEDRWRPLVETFGPNFFQDPFWPRLARAFDRAEQSGYDVAARVPKMIAAQPLPERLPARDLFYHLGSECHAAFGPIPAVTWTPSVEHISSSESHEPYVSMHRAPTMEGPSR